ncbi:ferredoxin--NADP reductase [Echinicola jeungdonensis]|uniref:2Fe-2S iron-sulfur cluster-binding protein n=1 Tax=Echinicola jeungdonensis TaxID=709343 RepID=A0ABV5J2S7_9BACT|nr:ferredoxin--NADP reductase [Echinicola jeungdonensis]MDN3668449.1 ferredoxin--NADP reductase [Echinicola jeungdonensis]
MVFSLFKKNKEEKKKGSQYLSLKVREVVKETSEAVTIYFEQPEPYLEYKPGQFLTLILEVEGKEERRSYSLCTSPYVDPHPGITIKRIEGGVVSNFLNDKIRPGKTIEVMKPMGHFTIDFHSKNKNHFVMVAGGSGITPVLGITKSILVNEPKSKVTLVYCNRSEDQIIFNDQLEELEAKYEDTFEVVHTLSRPSDQWSGYRGRLDEEMIEMVLKEKVHPEAEEVKYFLCGPEGLMHATIEALQKFDVPHEAIHRESFYTSSSEEAEKTEPHEAEGDQPELTREVEVELDGDTFQFEVSPGKTILEAGLDEGLDMPYSCQSGLCTACRGKLTSGEVQMDEDAGLSENEKKDGYILCCVSHPKSGDIKINIG